MTSAPPRVGDLLTVARRVADPGTTIHLERLPARTGRAVGWPAWVPEELLAALAKAGIQRPWTHQAEFAELAHAGRHAVLATGTASGKSLGYQLPVLSALLADPRATALYLSPTKALAADQLRALTELGVPGVRPGRYDGDTPADERDWVRAHARLVLTNPDMLHRGLLPQHARWAQLLRRLRYVVIDECHAYRGVFGSHVGLVLRRLRRVARRYGADPVFLLASATVADPAASAERLIGSPVVAVTDDGAPRAGADFLLWEPPVLGAGDAEQTTEDDVLSSGSDVRAPARRSAPAEAARLLASMVAAGARTLAFVRSRHGAEQTALSAQRRLAEDAPGLVSAVASYRGGYLPEERRALERALTCGELLGVATTNALELGVDISGLDATVIAGYPGTIASMWQQAGRAGRGDDRALVVFVARDDPLDSYLIHHPRALFGRPVEATITDPSNPHVLAGELACAAAEQHLTEDDVELFGGDRARPVLDDLVERKVLRRRPSGWFHASDGHPADGVDLRGSGAGQVVIVEADTGRMLGTVDTGRAPSAVHPGAVHLHRGESYTVLDLDLDTGVALVRADRPTWTTAARSTSTVQLTHVEQQRQCGAVGIGLGTARVTEQVIGYLRRRPNGEIIDQVSLDLPEQTLDTRAVWYTITAEALAAAGLSEADSPGALHAAEHAAIGLLPLFAGCDRWDIGGLSTTLHPDTLQPTVIVYDGFPGGAGFADRGHQVILEWLTAVRTLLDECPCPAGCPSCVQSPKCGNGNHPLDKTGAAVVLDLVLTASDRPYRPAG